jgi:hypothetical protein
VYGRQAEGWIVANDLFTAGAAGAAYINLDTGITHHVESTSVGEALWRDHSTGNSGLISMSTHNGPVSGSGGSVTISDGPLQGAQFGRSIELCEPGGGAVKLEGGQVNITTPKGRDVLINGSRPVLEEDIVNETRRALNWAKSEIAELRGELHRISTENQALWDVVNHLKTMLENQ